MSAALTLTIPDEELERLAVRVAELVTDRLAAPGPERPPALFSTEQAATWFGRSTRWVRERMKAGELAYVRLDGGPPRFQLEDLRRFADERRIACNPVAPAENALHLDDFAPRRLRDVQKARGSA